MTFSFFFLFLSFIQRTSVEIPQNPPKWKQIHTWACKILWKCGASSFLTEKSGMCFWRAVWQHCLCMQEWLLHLERPPLLYILFSYSSYYYYSSSGRGGSSSVSPPPLGRLNNSSFPHSLLYWCDRNPWSLFGSIFFLRIVNAASWYNHVQCCHFVFDENAPCQKQNCASLKCNFFKNCILLHVSDRCLA